MIDENDPKQVAEALRAVREWLIRTRSWSVNRDVLKFEADMRDPPYKLNRVPPVSDWPRSATYIGVYYANGRGPIDLIFHIDREQAERMEQNETA